MAQPSTPEVPLSWAWKCALHLALLALINVAAAQETPEAFSRRLLIEADQGFPPGQMLRSPTDDSLKGCDQAKELLARPKTRTTASERLAAATTVKACIEVRKSQLSVQQAEVARAAGAGAPVVPNVVALAYAPTLAAAERDIDTAIAQVEFLGVAFGLGVGLSWSSEARITGATVAPDGTVRVTGSQKQTPRVIFEAHYFGFCKLESCNEGKMGIGPFFGLAATGDEIQSFAVGLMIGRKDPAHGKNAGFSLGVGAVLDREVTTLASGFEEGKPLPPGETAVVLETKSKWSPLLFFTRTF